jgi:hypothetical protein
MWHAIVLILQLTTVQLDAAQAAYHKLPAKEITAHKATTAPPSDARRIDVSERIRSASFGHKTWLLVGPDGKQFWVEYGRSTNTPAAMYGPFPIAGN